MQTSTPHRTRSAVRVTAFVLLALFVAYAIGLAQSGHPAALPVGIVAFIVLGLIAVCLHLRRGL